MGESGNNRTVSFESESLKPGVSVVVCCYNSASVIVSTIEALSKQDVPLEIPYEVILVDNNCTDNTVQLAKNTWKNLSYPLRIIKESAPGLIFARKTGVNKAQYNILLFVDDDNILNPDWVKKIYNLYDKMPNVGAICGYNEALIQGEKPHWFDRYQGVYACGPRDNHSGLNPGKIFGAGLSFRTEVIKSILFSDLPLFLVGRTKNILLRGEDTEMGLRCRLAGWDFYYDSSLKLRHNLLSQKLTWNYVSQARKGGGIAAIILKIYFELLEGKEPLNFSSYVSYVLRLWKKYFKKNKTTFFLVNKKGSETSFLFYRLWGMSRGLFLYRKTYESIRKQMIEYFKPFEASH